MLARLLRIITRFGFLLMCCGLGFIAGSVDAADESAFPGAPAVEIRQPGIKLTLLAQHPQLVTPTGIDVDVHGQLWMIACHTHFRPDEYQGPVHDEVLVFDPDGGNRRVFYNQTDATMQILLGPDGWVYLAERDRILRVRDSDGDGRGDVEEELAVLNTVADYPHNGLSGMAWHPDGRLAFSLGENFGRDWTLTGTDQQQVSGRGEGGIFFCTADGRELRRIARGFWNPFGLLIRSDGEMFAAENDPGSRPPCRLLNVVEGADYGFQWVYGSSAVHPFIAWNGELRGTLGMVHPIGEGPCSVVELGGGLLVPSWSSHVIDYLPLHRQGAGYTAERLELLKGAENFRPVCLTPGNAGVFYLTDWVSSSYQLHSQGRLWKLEIDSAADWIQRTSDPENDDARLARELRSGKAQVSVTRLLALAQGGDPMLSDAALTALAHEGRSWTPETLRNMTTEDRLWALVALRRTDLADAKWVQSFLSDPDPEIQFECLRWIADGVLTQFQDEVQQLLNQPDLEFRLFEAALAAWNTLQGKPEAGVTDVGILLSRLNAAETPVRIRGFALRLIPPAHPELTVERLCELDATGDAVLSAEVVRTLAARQSDDARVVLAAIAGDESRDVSLRADAVAGLAGASDTEQRRLLLQLAAEAPAVIREEALRSLRMTDVSQSERGELQRIADTNPASGLLVNAILDLTSLQNGRPAFADLEGWRQRLSAVSGEPDVEVGRRVFFHPRIAACANCHRYEGRGNVVGPDLSLASRQGTEDQLLQSILDPSRDVAPQFYTSVVELADGTVFSGILLRSSSTEVFRDATGKERSFPRSEIVQRREIHTSMMPGGQVAQLTDAELRDLIAFLRQGRDPGMR